MRSAQIFLDHGPDGGERLGRHPVPQQSELADQFGRKDALAGREDLAQLDVGRPEGLERHPQPAGQAGTRRLGLAPPAPDAALEEIPASQRPGQLGGDAQDPTARRQPAPAQQLGDLCCGGGPKGVVAQPAIAARRGRRATAGWS